MGVVADLKSKSANRLGRSDRSAAGRWFWEIDRVLLLSMEHFRGRDGMEISQSSGSVYTFRDGRIVRLQAFWERENALEAAGRSRD